MKKLYAILFFFMFAFSIFSSINFSVAGDLSSLKINLIYDSDDYTKYGFKDLGIYYTPMALCEFHMPFAVPKKDSGSINKNDLSGNLLDTPSNLISRKPTLKYTILAENDNYYIIDYQMNIKASTDSFSVDFVPSVKTKSFSEFAWWDSEWGYKKQITINKDYIDAALTNFPILINASGDSSLYGKVNANLSDIRFTLSDETTRLNHEINDYTIGASNVSFNIWVNVTSISDSVDTVIYMYFDNNGAAPLSTADINATWDINYSGVYHLEGNNGKLCKDSTVNQNSMNYSGDLPTKKSFGVGMGQYFDADNDNITIPTDIYTNGVEPFTFECIYNSDSTTQNQEIMEFSKSAPDFVFLRLEDDGKYRAGAYTGNVEMWMNDNTDSYDINTHYLGYSWGDSDMVLIEDSGIIHTDTSYTFVDYTDPYTRGSHIGIGYDETRDFNGTMDEVRFSNMRRSNAWLNASYDTYYQSDFAVFGSLERYATVTMSNPDPINESVDISPYAQNVSITITEPDGNTMDVYFRSNSSGSWVDFGTNITVTNGTYHQVNSNFSGFSTTYWWCVNLTNGTAWENNTYHFTTRAEYTPTVPTGINAILEDSDSLNITWTKGTYAYNTLVVMKADSYPTSRTDGAVLYNGTLPTYTDNSFNSTRNYVLYSYNATDGLYSSGVNVEWGSLTINVFNESSGAAISDWDVFITNPVTLETYENETNNNPLMLDVDDVPNGDDVTIQVSAIGYKTRQYVMDLATNAQYTLNAHLAQENDSELYEITVVGPQGEFTSPPVEDVRVAFSRYINVTVGWETIAIKHTDANGKFNIYLIPDVIYQVNLSKDDYDTATAFYTPDSTDLTKEFRILPSAVVGDEWDIFWDTITFTATMDDPGYLLNSNITVVYADSNSSTTSYRIRVYDVFNNSVEVNDSGEQTDQGNTYIYGAINNTRTYRVELTFVNTANFDVSSPISIMVYPTHTYRGERTPFDIEDRMDNIFGPFTVDGNNIGWASIVSVSLALIVLVLFGPFNAGLGIIGCGMMLGFTQALYGLVFSNAFNPMLTLLAPVCICLGILYIWSKGDPGAHL